MNIYDENSNLLLTINVFAPAKKIILNYGKGNILYDYIDCQKVIDKIKAENNKYENIIEQYLKDNKAYVKNKSVKSKLKDKNQLSLF
jgi:hypothetical protein